MSEFMGGNLMLTIWLWMSIGMVIATVIVLKVWYTKDYEEDESDYSKF